MRSSQTSVFFYRQAIEAEKIGLESHVMAEDLSDRIITGGEMTIRYLSLTDDSKGAREQWLKAVARDYAAEDYSEKSSAFMSSHTGDYDALIIGGKDAARIIRIMRYNFPLLKTKMKICLTAGSSAKSRAQLIMAGFDDAIDVQRIDPREGVVRMRAIWRRYVEWYGRQESERIYLDRLAQIIDLDDLTEREKKLIACLELTPGRTVPHATLRALISYDWEAVSAAHLKVVISTLRRKLRPGVEINVVRGEGYRLDIHKSMLAVPQPEPVPENRAMIASA